MKKRADTDWVTGVILALLLVLFIGLGVSWDVYRWKTFQDVNHSDVGYWKWKMVIEKSSKK